MDRIGGIIKVKVNSVQEKAKGEFTYHLGVPKREVKVGVDTVHGYVDTPVAPYIEGTLTDRKDLKIIQLMLGDHDTISLQLANGKRITLSDAVFTGEGTGKTGEGEIAVRWDGSSAKEVAA